MQRLALAAALFVAMWPLPALAQPSCRFVLGFADLRAQVGATTVGDCIDDERHNPTNGDGRQASTRGELVWRKVSNTMAFTDGHQTWAIGPNGLQRRLNTERFSWEPNESTVPAAAPAARATAAPSSSATPAPRPAVPGSDALGDARSTCFHAMTDGMISSLRESDAVRQRAEAEASAKGYLCEQALERDGPKGVACYTSAWATARGLEQAFAGSGRQAYDEAYARCMAGR